MQGSRLDDKSDNGDGLACAVLGGAGWVRISGAGRPAHARCAHACANRRIYSHANRRIHACAHTRCDRNNAANANNCACYAPAYQFGAKGLPAHYRIRRALARRAATARRATRLLRRYHAAPAAKPVARGRSHPLS